MTSVATRGVQKRARLATFLTFTAAGFLIAVWLVHIPAVREQTGISHDVLGFTFLALGAGTFLAMQVSGALVGRVGTKPIMIGGVALMAATLVLPAFTWDGWSLAAALFCFGFANGICEVAMNAEAVEIEIDLRRPVMSSFHAMFSVGTALGAGAGALLQMTNLGIVMSFIIVSVIGFGIAAAIMALLPARPLERFGVREEARAESGTKNHSLRIRIIILGVLAFLMMLAEGVANDWSALHATEQFSADASTAALAYGTFAVAMTIGRFTVDRIVMAFGPVFVVRYGSLLAAVGLTGVVLSPSFGISLVGWAVFALGISGIVPQIFTSSGNLPVANRQVILARVVGAGYIGMLAGPAVVGWLAEAFTLNLALLAPIIMCVFGAVAASVVASTSAKPSES
ncbi:MAG: MFS transporter [Leucobacter sp.]